jgi:rhodanese-related sulfurtransferase
MCVMRLFLQLATISLSGAGLGVLLNATSTHPASLFKPVYPSSASSGVQACGGAPEAQGHRLMSQSEAVAACSSCTVGFVDARGAAAFAQGHIPGAVHLMPVGHPDEEDAIRKLRAFSTLVVYDSGGGCGLAEGVADRLTAAGFSDVRILEGSWSEWQAAGGPAQSGACQACGPDDDHPHTAGGISR